MIITLNHIGKKFSREWIFRNVNLQFTAGNHYAILGPNGSGKSTLLQLIAGNQIASEGDIKYELPSSFYRQSDNQFVATNGAHRSASDAPLNLIPSDQIYRYTAICAPYLQLIEEMTLSELIAFHKKFKSFCTAITHGEEIIDLLQLSQAGKKQIRYYSSGMKQRVKLGLALLSDVKLIILDEPLTNLDEQGKAWYYELLSTYAGQKIVLIGSNRPDEYCMCHYKIDILQYKS
jgi:ABC-type multidrug transport system ATPase subunit